MGDMPCEIAIVEEVVAHGDRFFETPHVMEPIRRYQQRIAWFDDALIGSRGIEEGKALEIRPFWIDLPAIQKVRTLRRKEDSTFSTSNLS